MENLQKHSLGRRAFTIFLLRRIKITLFLVVFTVALWYAERWIVSPYYSIWWNYAAEVMLLVTIGYFVLIFILTYLEYRYYTYSFTDEAFIVTNGYMVRNEIAALYHQIQNVNISRGMLDRAIGVSSIVIVMIGSGNAGDKDRIVLEAIGKKKARLVQQEILSRARRHTIQPGS